MRILSLQDYSIVNHGIGKTRIKSVSNKYRKMFKIVVSWQESFWSFNYEEDLRTSSFDSFWSKLNSVSLKKCQKFINFHFKCSVALIAVLYNVKTTSAQGNNLYLPPKEPGYDYPKPGGPSPPGPSPPRPNQPSKPPSDEVRNQFEIN